MENLNMSSPWVIYFRQVEALFKEDPDVKVEFDSETYTLTLHVEGWAKAEAIEKLLPQEKEFGNVIVKVKVIPANTDNVDRITLLKKAFEGNPAVDDIIKAEVFGNTMNYVIFKKEVVQYYNDDISDFFGVCSTLYQDIAKEVLGEDEGVYFCTNV